MESSFRWSRHKEGYLNDEQIRELLDCERESLWRGIESDFLIEINKKTWIKEAQTSLYARTVTEAGSPAPALAPPRRRARSPSSAPLPSQLEPEPEPQRCVNKKCIHVDPESEFMDNPQCSKNTDCK